METVLELRALRTLLALVTAAGSGGTGRARRADDGLDEPKPGGRIWDVWDWAWRAWAWI